MKSLVMTQGLRRRQYSQTEAIWTADMLRIRLGTWLQGTEPGAMKLAVEERKLAVTTLTYTTVLAGQIRL